MKDNKSISKQQHLGEQRIVSVILLPLCPASLMHENPQRHKIIHGMRPQRSINRSAHVYLWQILWLLFNDAYSFSLCCALN